jgi:hypothetical protein
MVDPKFDLRPVAEGERVLRFVFDEPVYAAEGCVEPECEVLSLVELASGAQIPLRGVQLDINQGANSNA